VLLLLPTATYRAADFLTAARALGAEVVVASERRLVSMGDAQLTLDLCRPEAAAEAIAALAEDSPLDAVVAVDDQGVRVAALAAERLGLSGNPLEAVAATRDKAAMRRALAVAGVPQPEHRTVGPSDDAAAVAAEVGLPCVVKPLALSASRGVIRANTVDQFIAAFRRIAALLQRDDVEVGGDAVQFLLAEEYVPGVEVALEGLLMGGILHRLALFDKPDPLEGPFFEETIYVTPSRLPADVQDAIGRVAAAACAALGLSEGPVHAELRVNDAGPWVLEVAARSIGGLCSRTLRFGTGMTLEEIILRHALGLPIATLARERRPAGVMMIPIPRAGRLQAVGGTEAAAAVPGVEEVTITAHVGQNLIPLPEGWQYLGFIFARADSPDAVEAALRDAHARLNFTVT
jgi:biotin carboxylase